MIAEATRSQARDRRIVFWTVMISMIVLDQVVKALVRSHTPQSFRGLPWPGVFELTVTYNKGIAFGFFQGAGVFLAPVAVLIAVGSTLYSIRHPEEPTIGQVAMGLLAAGALGNLYDRVFAGKVTDMFWFRAIDFPVFNVADSCITIATVLLVLTWWSESARRKPAVKTVETQGVSAE